MPEEQKTTPVITVETTKTEPKTESKTSIAQESKTYAIIAHLGGLVFGLLPLGAFLGFIPALVIMLIKAEDQFIKQEAKEALNFQITLIFGYLISSVLILIAIGFVTWFALFITNVVFAIIATISVSDGKPYKYPFCIRLIK